MSELFTNLEVHRSWLTQVAENGARLARVVVSFITTGNGEASTAEPVPFGIHFLQAPVVASGVVLASGTLVAGQYPNTDAGVVSWALAEGKFVVGARLYFVCDSGGQDYTLQHHLTFEAPAIKFYPSELAE